MPILDAGTYNTLAAAVRAPNNYLSGAERKKLNAAFDLAASKILRTFSNRNPAIACSCDAN